MSERESPGGKPPDFADWVEITRAPVQSSNVVSLRRDPDTGVVEVEFRSGVYRYAGVPKQVFEAVRQAESVGSAVQRQLVRGGYAFRRVGPVSSELSCGVCGTAPIPPARLAPVHFVRDRTFCDSTRTFEAEPGTELVVGEAVSLR